LIPVNIREISEKDFAEKIGKISDYFVKQRRGVLFGMGKF